MPQPSPKTDELLDDDILTISSAERREHTLTEFIYDVLIFISFFTLCWAIAMADIFFLLKLMCGMFIVWLGINSLAPKLIILNKASNSITIKRSLFDRWALTQLTLPLANYYGVQVRSADGGSENLLVELVGKYGATLTLLNFDDIDEARDFRTTVAEWMKVKVLLDPTNPNYT